MNLFKIQACYLVIIIIIFSLADLKETLGISSIKPIEVIHCRWAYGLSIEHKSGWKLV